MKMKLKLKAKAKLAIKNSEVSKAPLPELVQAPITAAAPAEASYETPKVVPVS